VNTTLTNLDLRINSLGEGGGQAVGEQGSEGGMDRGGEERGVGKERKRETKRKGKAKWIRVVTSMRKNRILSFIVKP
jgi:hypothetical protein